MVHCFVGINGSMKTPVEPLHHKTLLYNGKIRSSDDSKVLHIAAMQENNRFRTCQCSVLKNL